MLAAGVEFHGAPKSTSLDENAMVFADNRELCDANIFGLQECQDANVSSFWVS